MHTDDGPDRARPTSMVPAALIVTVTWIAVAVSCVVQKRNVDADLSLGLSAVDAAIFTQRLNGSATSHMLVAIAIGLGVTAIAGFWAATAASRSAVAGFQVLAELQAQARRGSSPDASAAVVPSPTGSATRADVPSAR